MRDLAELDVFVQRELVRRAVFQQRTLAALDLGTGGREPVCDRVRDQADAVLVGVDQVAAVDLDPADLDGRIELDESDVGVADARIEAEELEPQRADLVQVARAAAGDVADAAELVVDRGRDLTELGAQAGRVVEVLADGDLGPGMAGDVAEVIAQEVELGLIGLGGAARVFEVTA